MALLALLPLAVLRAQTNYATPYTFQTFAGSAGNSSSLNGPATSASFLKPSAVAIDGSGNLYVADTGNNLIRKITSAGIVTTLAGSAGVFGGADGMGGAASFYSPQGIAVDGSGNVYVADVASWTIRKITSEGMVTTFADLSIPATTIVPVRTYDPIAMAVDGSGNVYAADSYTCTIRKITPMGVVSTLAGTAWVHGSDDGAGSAASFFGPEGIAVDTSGNVYVADTSNRTIRKINPAGVVTTLAGNLYNYGSADGTGTEAEFNYPRAVSVDAAGIVYVADSVYWDSKTSTIRKVTADGVVTTLAGGTVGYAEGLGTEAKFNNPLGIAVDNTGTIFVADTGNQTIRRVSAVGLVTTFAGGAGVPGFVDGKGGAARFNSPLGVAMDPAGNVLIADTKNRAIRRVTPAGMVTTAAVGPEPFFVSTRGFAVDGNGNSYSVYAGCQIAKTTPAGVSTILAGIGDSGSADGPGQNASFNNPQGLAVDATGNVYVADSLNCTIRKISITGDVSTLAGLAGYHGGADGIGNAARFELPVGIALDLAGNLYVVDGWNDTVRRITQAGVVTTLAGLANNPGATDGTGSAARFMSPSAIAVDGPGNIFVIDNHTIRKITSDGVVTTLGGQVLTTWLGSIGFADFSTSVGPAAHFPNPTGIAVDSLGQIYITDAVYNSIIVGGIVTAPAITGQPTGQSVIATQPVTFSVTATGGLLSYQWRKGEVNIAGASLPTLTLDSPAAVDAGSYDVVITNPQGSVTSSAATLTVTAIPPTITTQPASRTVVAGTNVSFSVAVSGLAPFTYQWKKDGDDISGATNSSYAIPSVVSGNDGSYTVVVTNTGGFATSNAATLILGVIPAGFEMNAYLARNPTVAAVYSSDLYAAWIHYRDQGIYDGEVFDDLFRVEEYLTLYPELFTVFGDDLTGALLHWLTQGSIEGRLGRIPLEFSATGYLDRNPDVAAAVNNDPLLAWSHYWLYGIYEGRYYDDELRVFEYLAVNADLTAAFVADWRAAALHWMRYGRTEGRLGRLPLIFNVMEYLNRSPDVAAVWGTNPTTVFLHYWSYGIDESRTFDDEFRPAEYLALNADLAAVFGTDLRGAFKHWARYGRAESRPGKNP